MCAQTAYSVFYSASDGSWFMMVALVGAVGGVALFFQGFRMLRYKRLILNTPFSKIRSASIGLVEVSGPGLVPPWDNLVYQVGMQVQGVESVHVEEQPIEFKSA